MTASPTIDTWVNLHLPGAPEEFWSNPTFAALLRQFHREDSVIREGEEPSEIVEAMDSLNVSRALLTPLPVQDFGGFEGQCELLANVAAKYSGRFDSAPLLPYEMGMAGARAVKTAIDLCMARVVRVMPALVGLPPNDRIYYPVYTKCVEEGLPITINVGLPGPALPASTQHPLALDDVCRDFPDLVVIATHMGWPWQSLLTGLILRHENLHMMTSAWAPKHYPEEVVKFIASRGRGRVMFASDHPLIHMRRCHEELAQLGFDEASLSELLHSTAEKVIYREGLFPKREEQSR